MALAIAACLLAPPTAQAAPTRLAAPAVRAFVARQTKAWNAGDLAGFYGLFTADAVFTDQARAPNGQVFPYGSSTLAEAKAQTRRALAGTSAHETTTIRTVSVARDGRSATVVSAEVSTLGEGRRARRSCAERRQTIVATPAGLRSKGQTDSIVRCR
jgi:uncharacterized protein (TIGR02246 family)